jgi:predicted nucleotidyltransferase
MIASKREGWPYLIKLSESTKRELRQVSLIRSYSWVEHALGASGYKREKKAVSNLIYSAYKDGFSFSSLRYDDIRDAIRTRHLAAHMDSVPSEDTCKTAIEVFKYIWESLKENYVTINNASEIARSILSKKGVNLVSLFGSLSRKIYSSYVEPNDIDLLVFDDGTYSSEIDINDRKYLDSIKLTRIACELLELHQLKYVVNCRWLDIVIIDGTKFGNDMSYTREMARCQPDRHFFLNISMDIMDFYTNNKVFSDTNIIIFKKLRHIGNQLVDIGFL